MQSCIGMCNDRSPSETPSHVPLTSSPVTRTPTSRPKHTQTRTPTLRVLAVLTFVWTVLQFLWLLRGSNGLTSKRRISCRATLRAPVFILKVRLSRCLCFSLSAAVLGFMCALSVCLLTCVCLLLCLCLLSVHSLFLIPSELRATTAKLVCCHACNVVIPMPVRVSRFCLNHLRFSLECLTAVKTGDCSFSLHLKQTVFCLAMVPPNDR